MNTTSMYQSSANSTYKPSFFSQASSYQSTSFGVPKTVLTRFVKPFLRSTVAAVGIAMIPTCVIASTTPTNPPVANIAAQAQEKLAFAVHQFDLSSTRANVFSFLKDNHDASKLLAGWSTISNSVFGSRQRSSLEVIMDIEKNTQILTIEIHTGIEDEEAFLKIEEKLFSMIEASSLERGLENVVLSLY